MPLQFNFSSHALALVLMSLLSTKIAAQGCAGLEALPITFAPMERALDIPLQLGFVRRAEFANTIADLRGHLEKRNAERDPRARRAWTLRLVQILPISTVKSVASFFAYGETDEDALIAEDRPVETVNVVFMKESGRIVEYRASAEEPLGHPGAEMRLGAPVLARIKQHARYLVGLLPRISLSAGDRALFIAEARVEQGLSFAAKNNHLNYVEIFLQLPVFPVEDRVLLSPRRVRLVYEVDLLQRWRLAAVDHDDLRHFVRP